MDLTELTTVLLDALEEWEVIQSAADVTEKTTVGYGESAIAKKTQTFMGWKDVRNKLQGEARAKKLWLHVRIASDPPAQPPGGRRGATNPSQGGGGRGSRRNVQGASGTGVSRTHGMVTPNDINIWNGQLKAKYHNRYKDEQYQIWATAIANGECKEDMLTPAGNESALAESRS